MACIHHYSIMLNSFNALKFPVVSLSLLPSHNPLATTDLFTVSVVLSFLETHIIRSIRQVAFSDWLLSLSNIQSGFFHVFSLLDNSFIFYAE